MAASPPVRVRTVAFPRPEHIIRPFTSVDSSSRMRTPEAPPEVNPDAFIRWGAAADFTTQDFRGEATNLSTISVREADDDDDKPKRKRFTYSEEGRKSKEFKVEGNDPDAYIILRMATAVAFNGPKGNQFVLNMIAGAPGTQTGSGQTPPAPPALGDIE